MDLRRLMQVYQEDGLAIDLASARVCQDIVLMAIAKGPLNRNVGDNTDGKTHVWSLPLYAFYKFTECVKRV